MAEVPQVKSQVQDKIQKYNSCLVISRHQLTQIQQEDVESICNQIDIKPELPTDQNQLKQFIQPYDAIIGVLPINLQIQLLQNKKVLITFVMKSLGVFENKQDAEQKASQYPNRAVILAPSKEGEKFRVTLYEGIKLIKEIKVLDEWIIQHSS